MIKKHLPTIIVAMVTAAVTAAAPSLAAAFDALNADKVDGKHAVGAGATAKKRKNKLVATNRKGKLPNSIIAKAPNADKLDGLSSKSFMRGGGRLSTFSTTVDYDSAETLAVLPGIKLIAECVITQVAMELTADWSEAYGHQNGESMSSAGSEGKPADSGTIVGGFSGGPSHWEFSAVRRTGGATRVVEISVYGQYIGSETCAFHGTAIQSSA